MNWPAGMGKQFLGIFDRQEKQFVQFKNDEDETQIPYADLDLPEHEKLVSDANYQAASEELELLDEAGDSFSLDDVSAGKQTPVFFGSALAPFGVDSFFNTFISMAPAPAPRKSTEGVISPDNPDFSGFIFKIQANMNPAHRDRVAFLRVCSGKFERGMHVKLTRNDKQIKLAQSQQFVASSGDTVEEAYAGDIIGIYDPNIYRIGDTLVSGKNSFEYAELPQFPPEMFNKVTAKNVMKSKQFKKGIEQLVQEGAIQLFYQDHTESYILGAVG